MDFKNFFDNDKFSKIVSLLNEMYDHMRERTGYPKELHDPDNFSEGTISFSFSFVNDPYLSWKDEDGNLRMSTSVYFRTVYLPRQLETAQIFQDMDHLYDQTVIWHKNEMSRPLDDKTIYNWYDYHQPTKVVHNTQVTEE